MPVLRALHHVLPETRLSNDDLVAINPTWSAEKIFAKTGIRSRPVAAPGQTAGDLGFLAADSMLDQLGAARGEVDAIVFISQSPDYFLPPTACLLQDRLGLSDRCAAFDVNLGCSGFTYGLWLAGSLVEANTARQVLLICADTYSRYCDRQDLATVTLFGDGAAAALVSAAPERALALLGPTVLGTDGRGARDLIVPQGGGRSWATGQSTGPSPRLVMDGPEVFRFALDRVGAGIDQLLATVRRSRREIDLFLFHQANRFMLETLRDHLELPDDRLPIDVEEVGNLATASLPVLVSRCLRAGTIGPGCHCVLVGFGVGFSWGMTYAEWL